MKFWKYCGNRITVTELPGLRNVVSLKETVHKILHEKWYAEKKTNRQDERKRVVEAVAAIVRKNIRAFVCDCIVYPSTDLLQDEHGVTVPETLQCLIDGVLCTPPQQRKSRTLIEAIIAATRPRSFISPVLFGVGVYMHRYYASRQLIDLLSSLGISATYKETLRYEYSASVNPDQMPRIRLMMSLISFSMFLLTLTLTQKLWMVTIPFTAWEELNVSLHAHLFKFLLFHERRVIKVLVFPVHSTP